MRWRLALGSIIALVALFACTSTSNLAGGENEPPAAGDCGGKTCSFANAEATCSNGICQLGTCNAGFRDCNGGPENGCETYVLGGDPEHCGSCSTKCAYAHAVSTCEQGGVCKMGACADGYADCKEGPVDGCETLIGGDDAANCGACGKTCLLGQVCKSGKCIENEVSCTSPGVMCAQPTCYIAGRFSIAGEIVVDRENGRRLWSRTVEAFATFSNANLFCQNLKLAGINSGWRLPTYPELAKLLYQAGGLMGCPTCAPATDQAAFPGVVPDGTNTLWTTTSGGPQTYETVNFCDGRSNYDSDIVDPHPFRCTHDPL